MSDLRVLYVIDSLAPGGAETSLAEMAPQLIASGVDLHILPLGPPVDLAKVLEAAGASIHVRSTRHGRVGNVRAVTHAVKEVRPHLIHTTLYESDIAGRMAARLTGTRVSSSVVGDTYGAVRRAEVNGQRLNAALAMDRLTARHVSAIHAVSESLAEAASVYLKVSRRRIEVIPRGRDPDTYHFQAAGMRQATRHSLGISIDTPVILTVGRLEPAKGHIQLLRALPLLATSYPGLVTLIAGKDGESTRILRHEASRTRLDIRFLGHRPDIPALLTAADVLCFPSLREGSPGALIEAMAVGCPIVASDIYPNIEVLGVSREHARTTYRVGDHRQLAARLENSLSDKTGAADLARWRRARFEENYTIQTVAQRMNQFFHRAAHHERPHSGAT